MTATTLVGPQSHPHAQVQSLKSHIFRSGSRRGAFLDYAHRAGAFRVVYPRHLALWLSRSRLTRIESMRRVLVVICFIFTILPFVAHGVRSREAEFFVRQASPLSSYEAYTATSCTSSKTPQQPVLETSTLFSLAKF